MVELIHIVVVMPCGAAELPFLQVAQLLSYFPWEDAPYLGIHI